MSESPVLADVAAVASILAGLAAAFAFGLGVTKTTRLRRRETLFREALGVFGPGDGSRDAVTELHRAALSEIIARQLTSPWRTIWPWMVWLATVALAAQFGYSTSVYQASDAKWDYYSFTVEVFGDSLTPFFMVAVVLGVLPQVFYSFLFTVVGRAEVARNFFDGFRIERPSGLKERAMQAELQSRTARQPDAKSAEKARDNLWGSRLRNARASTFEFGTSTVPGLFAISLGITIGLSYWLETQTGDGVDDRAEALNSLGAFPAIAIFSVSTLGMLTLLVATRVAREVRRFALPSAYPRSPLILVRHHPTRSQ